MSIIKTPVIKLYKDAQNMDKWAVIACDQYTSQVEYWQQADQLVGEHPSTLRMILPEVYLEDCDLDAESEKIYKTMEKYLFDNVFSDFEGFVLIDRKTPQTPSRKGIVLAIDLEYYDYKAGAKPKIRATEGTVIERLPPRIKIRENAALELPHVMLLIDDPEDTVIGPLFEKCDRQLYDFELMLDGGHITAWGLDGSHCQALSQAFEKLEKDNMVFAVGDGNHTLAAAKAHWENLKKAGKAEQFANSRYALVEVNNIYDPGIVMHPIHRILKNTNSAKFTNELRKYFKDMSLVDFETPEELIEYLNANYEKGHMFGIVCDDCNLLINLANPSQTTETGSCQNFLDYYCEKDKNSRVDYIHGEDVVLRLSAEPGTLGFILPPIKKHSIFSAIINEGVLPRKTFSIGHANEKRYYIEAREIR